MDQGNLYLVLALLLSWASYGACNETSYYRWQDEQGRWHYSDRVDPRKTQPAIQKETIQKGTIQKATIKPQPAVKVKPATVAKLKTKRKATRGNQSLSKKLAACEQLEQRLKGLRQKLKKDPTNSIHIKKARDLRWQKHKEC